MSTPSSSNIEQKNVSNLTWADRCRGVKESKIVTVKEIKVCPGFRYKCDKQLQTYYWICPSCSKEVDKYLAWGFMDDETEEDFQYIPYSQEYYYRHLKLSEKVGHKIDWDGYYELISK